MGVCPCPELEPFTLPQNLQGGLQFLQERESCRWAGTEHSPGLGTGVGEWHLHRDLACVRLPPFAPIPSPVSCDRLAL